MIWKLKDPANVQFFVWQFSHGALPTKGMLAERGIPIDPACPFCGAGVESIEHCLFLYGRVAGVFVDVSRLSGPSLIQVAISWSFYIS